MPKETAKETTGETGPELETEGNGVVHASIVSPPKRRRPGPQVPANWPTRFLEYYAEEGVRWRGAKHAGVAYETLLRAERADPEFARQVEDARQTYLDRHALNINRLAFKRGNLVASIVALKAGRPEYVEKNMTITASIATQLTPEDGKALLQAMLDLPPAWGALEAAGPDPARVVLDSEPSGPPASDAPE